MASGPGNADVRFQYTGQTWLPEIGAYNYKARIYSPTLGRFLQTDPIGIADHMNMYAYTGGDPVNKTDPSGTAQIIPGYQYTPPPDQGGIGFSNYFAGGVWSCTNCGSPGAWDGKEVTTTGPQYVWSPFVSGFSYASAGGSLSGGAPDGGGGFNDSWTEGYQPKYCRSTGYKLLDALDTAGSRTTDVGAVLVVLGAFQGAAAPATAGTSAASGLAFGTVGVGFIGIGSGAQVIGKFGKAAISDFSPYFTLDNAVNLIGLNAGATKKQAAALASYATSKFLTAPGRNPCE